MCMCTHVCMRVSAHCTCTTNKGGVTACIGVSSCSVNPNSQMTQRYGSEDFPRERKVRKTNLTIQ